MATTKRISRNGKGYMTRAEGLALLEGLEGTFQAEMEGLKEWLELKFNHVAEAAAQDRREVETVKKGQEASSRGWKLVAAIAAGLSSLGTLALTVLAHAKGLFHAPNP